MKQTSPNYTRHMLARIRRLRAKVAGNPDDPVNHLYQDMSKESIKRCRQRIGQIGNYLLKQTHHEQTN